MNGGIAQPLPVRNTTARPVSFHSLSEHNRNNPTFLSPYSHRRPRTPRSSPLAGPSLSSDQVDSENKDDERSQKPRYRPNRISSTPDMVAPIQSLYDSDTAAPSPPPSIISNGGLGIVVSSPPISNSSASSSSGEDDPSSKSKEDVEDPSRLRNFAKRLSSISLTTNESEKDANKRRSGLISHSSSTTSLSSTSSSRTARTDNPSQTAPPIPTIPRWALNAMGEQAPIPNRNIKYGHRRGTSGDLTSSPSLPPLPNQPIPRGLRPSTSGLSNQPRPPSISRDPRENWMSVTDPIPKFSRLGLGGDGVVMPVKKKENLARMKSSSSIKSTRSTATISQSTGTRRDGGLTTRTEPSPNRHSDVTITEPNLKEDGLRKRPSLAGSLKKRISKITVSSSAETENVPPLPPSLNQSGSVPVSNSNSHTPISNGSSHSNPKTPAFPPTVVTPNTRRSVTLRGSSDLTAIDENQLPSSSPNDTEVGMRVGDVKSQDTQKTRARRKSIKQIVMRITTAPMPASEKLKLGANHNPPSRPMVVLPPDTLTPLNPPPAAWFGKPASPSLPGMPSTKETSELSRSQGDLHGSKRFRGIKRRWNAVFATVRC